LDGLRPTVVWDVDDVLNDLLAAWLAQVWASEHADRPIAYADVRANPPHEFLRIERGAYLASLDDFRTGGGYAAMAPNPRVLAWLEANGERCHHVALTATAFRAVPTTAAWVLRHFGRWIREFAFVPAERPGETLPRYDEDKGAWLARRGVTVVLVDDGLGNLASAAAAGAATVRWPQPWNGAIGTQDEALAELDRWLMAAEIA
jgi:FMN phosphatase YigB (HAD superfamily)